MATVTSGQEATAESFNDLFSRLNAIRANHKGKNGQNDTANAAFATTIKPGVRARDLAQAPDDAQKIKDALEFLSKSEWLSTTFASKVTIPTVGELLKASDYNGYDAILKEVEAVCPNYSKYNQYGAYADYQYSYGQ